MATEEVNTATRDRTGGGPQRWTPLSAVRLMAQRALDLLKEERTPSISVLFLAAAVVGAAAALINEGLHWLLRAAHDLRFLIGDLVGGPLGGGVIILVPVAGMALLLVLEKLFPGEIGGYGLPYFLELVNVRGAAIRSRWIALKSLAASLTIGLGLSAGLEGPLVQIGGALGSSVGRPFSLSTGRLRVLIAAGAAAMIATTFDAPLAGVLFAQEIVLVGSFELATFSLVVVAAGMAVAIARIAFPGHAVLSIPAVAFPINYELLLHVVIGAAIGLLAVLYAKSIVFAHRFLRPARNPDRTWGRSLAVALLIGLMGWVVPGVAGDGLQATTDLLRGEIPLYLLGAAVLLKIFATAGTLGAGGGGGIFAPAVLIGAAAGYGSAAGLRLIFPNLIVQPADFGLVGICAMLGAVTHAPLTSIFLLFELTRVPEVLLPGMLGVAAAIMASRILSPDTVESLELRSRGIDIHASLVERIMAGMTVQEIMRRDVQVIPPELSVLDFAHYAAATYHKYFPVIRKGVLLGVVTLDDLGPILDEPEQWRHLLVADLLRSGQIVWVRPHDDLATAEALFQKHGFEQIPVVEEQVGEGAGGVTVVGILHRADLERAAARRKLMMQLPR